MLEQPTAVLRAVKIAPFMLMAAAGCKTLPIRAITAAPVLVKGKAVAMVSDIPISIPLAVVRVQSATILKLLTPLKYWLSPTAFLIRYGCPILCWTIQALAITTTQITALPLTASILQWLILPPQT